MLTPVQGHLSTRFASGKLPWDIFVAQNAVLNREMVDIAGYTPGVIIPARNNYERLERAGDVVAWLLIGFGLPLVIGKTVFKGKIAQRIVHDFKLKAPSKEPLELLNTRLEDLDAAKLKNPEHRQVLAKTLGLPHLKHLDALRDQILNAKIKMIALDQVLMSTACCIWPFAKIKLTERLSGKKGFVGEFETASDQYREQKNQSAQQQFTGRAALALTLAYGASLALPFLILKPLLNSVTPLTTLKLAKNWAQRFKALVPKFNYNNSIYMSKACLVWSSIFGWDASQLLSARDSHELREKAISNGFLAFSYFFSDELFSAGLAKGASHFYKDPLAKTPVLRPNSWRLKPLPEIYKTYGEGAALRYARFCYWGGLLGASALTGFGITVINNWVTAQKVKADQAKHALSAPMALPQRPLSPATASLLGLSPWALSPFPIASAYPLQVL